MGVSRRNFWQHWTFRLWIAIIFNADTVTTHIMMEDDMLYIYNEYKDETKTSQVYRYDLTNAGQEDALSMVDDATEIETIQKKWKKVRGKQKGYF